MVWYLVQTPGCQGIRGEQIGEAGGRGVGIFVRGDGDGNGGTDDSPAMTTEKDVVAAPAVETEPPISLSLPDDRDARVIGAGRPPRAALDALAAAGGAGVAGDGGVGTGGKGNGRGRGFGQGGGIGNGTSMFGVQTKGKRFVYVIDHSSSMYDVLPAAKGQLLASIERLDQQQQFQVVFFNENVQELRNRTGMFHGLDGERLVVRQQLQEFSAEGGTSRLPALLKALEYGPDVIYFLTDSDGPMPAADLERVRRSNRGAQIHCIEFGEGPAPADVVGRAVPNFLHKLAEVSKGSYVYFDTQRLPEP